MLLDTGILHDERRRFIVLIVVAVFYLVLLNISDFGIVPQKVFIRLDVHDRYAVVADIIIEVWMVSRAISTANWVIGQHLVCLEQLEAALRTAGASSRLPFLFHFNLVNVPGLLL